MLDCERTTALRGKRILIVEDRYLLADDLTRIVAAGGGEVVGPAATVAEAVRIVEDQQIDAALLDIDLRGERVFALADLLAERGIPYAFATGFERAALPDAHLRAPYLAKPLSEAVVTRTLGELLKPSS